MKNFIFNNRGMTLAEVVIAAILVAIIVVSMLATVTQSSVFSQNIDIAYTASNLAQRRIDWLKRFDFDQVPGNDETDVRIGADGNIDANGNYLRSTEITQNYDSNSHLLKVKVSVKRVRVRADGTIKDPSTGQVTYVGAPVVMETLLADIK